MIKYMFRTCPQCGYRVPSAAGDYEYNGHLKPQLPRILELLREGRTPYQIALELKLPYPDEAMIAYLRRKYGIVREKSDATTPRNIKLASRYNSGDITYRKLGEEFGISAVRARDIVLRVEQQLLQQSDAKYARQTAKRIEDVPIEALTLTVRTLNGLRNMECTTVGEAMKIPPERMLGTHNFGRVSLLDWQHRLLELKQEFSARESKDAKP